MAELALSLLLGVPTTLDDFLQAVSGHRDFTLRYAANPGRHWSENGGYRESVAAPLQALAADIERIGGHVVTNACLADVSAAARDGRIVIVLAHTKGAMVQSPDILDGDPLALSSNLIDHVDQDLRRLGRSLRKARRVDIQKLAREMNATLRRIQLRMLKAAAQSRGASRHSIRPEHAMAKAREMLDVALQGKLTQGQSLELRDGLHNVAALDQSIDAGFAGVLDLTSCVSTVFADELDRRRMGSFRTVMFDQFLPPDIASLALRQTVATAPNFEPIPYLQARAEAIRAVAEAIGDEIRATRNLARKPH